MTVPVSLRRPPSNEPPPFSRIGVVGIGLIGASVAMAIRRSWPSVLIVGVDAKPVVEQASVGRVIDVGADDLGLVSEAELIVLAAPVRENVAVLLKLPEYVSGEAIVTDVGSTKRAIVDAAKALPSRLPFVPGHPLAGAAVGGLSNARPDLFDNRPWFLCPASHQNAADRVEQVIRAAGGVPRAIDPAAHDRLMAFLSHLPQLTVSVLMQVVGDAVGDEGLALAGRGLKDTTRLASSPASIWTDICATNADEIARALDALIDTLRELRGDLTTDTTVTRILENAQHWRAKMPAP